MSEEKKVLSDAQTELVMRVLQRWVVPQDEDDVAINHGIRILGAMRVAQELIPVAASCAAAANQMMGGYDQSLRVLAFALNTFQGIAEVQDSPTLNVIEERLTDLSRLVQEALRPRGGSGPS